MADASPFPSFAMTQRYIAFADDLSIPVLWVLGLLSLVAISLSLVASPVLAQKAKAQISSFPKVSLKALGDAEIRAYHAAVDPLDKAGGYDINAHGPIPGGVVASIDGSYSNVMGLPMERLVPVLERFLTA